MKNHQKIIKKRAKRGILGHFWAFLVIFGGFRECRFWRFWRFWEFSLFSIQMRPSYIALTPPRTPQNRRKSALWRAFFARLGGVGGVHNNFYVDFVKALGGPPQKRVFWREKNSCPRHFFEGCVVE